MKTRRQAVLLVSMLLAAALPTTTVEAQVDQSALARQLLGQNTTERRRALEAARAIGPANTAPELRAALITLLERQNRIVAEATSRGAAVADIEDPEFIAQVSRVVSELRDPQAIPALSEAVYGGLPAIRALASFGQQAAPAVLRVVTSSVSHYDAVNHGLIALRFIVEEARMRRLSAGMFDEIRRAAEQRLIGKQYFTTLWRAIDLAWALDDPDLMRIVESLASDRDEVIARGVEDPELIERTQQLAADRLAGVRPLPRPRP